jgi:imidazolonepropionase-like amidohydrolase
MNDFRATGVGLLTALVAVVPLGLSAQASQGKPGTYFIRGGTVVTGTGQRLPNASVLVQNGRIAGVGNVQAPAGATVIDATGKFVYPGMIDSHTDMGLSEIGSVPATQDVSELGTYNPHMRALVAVNPSSELIAVTRANGVTAAITQPSGGSISGQAAFIHLDGWTQEDMAVRPIAGFVIQYPRSGGGGGRGGGGGAQDPDQERQARERTERAVTELRDYLTRARDYDRIRDAGNANVDLTLEALRPLFSGEAPAIMMADTKEQMEGAIKLGEDFGMKVIINGGDEAYKIAADLARKNVPVILGSIRSQPGNDVPYDAIYAQPGVLHRAGVKFAFSTGDAANARHVPYHAALAVAYGLPGDVAMQALTLWPAQIWGVADRLGSIEVGKSADLFIASGDPLDIRTTVSDVFIAGKLIPKDDRHTRLFEKYNARPKK